MQAYSLKRENGVTPIVGLHRIPAKKHPYGALAEVPTLFFLQITIILCEYRIKVAQRITAML